MSQQQLTAVVAYQVLDRGIGFENCLLYRLHSDLQHFRELTLHHIVLMGRKTFESIGKCLPQRVNVVLSRQQKPASETRGAHWFQDLHVALAWCRQHHPDRTVFVIGGAEIYQLILPWLTSVVATEITGHGKTADTFFPLLPDDFVLTESSPVRRCGDALSCAEVEFCVTKWQRTHTGEEEKYDQRTTERAVDTQH